MLLFILIVTAVLALMVFALASFTHRKSPRHHTTAHHIPTHVSANPIQDLVNHSLEAGVLVQDPEGRILYANEMAHSLLGLDRKHEGEKVQTPFPLPSLSAMVAIRSGKPVRNLVVSIFSAENQERWILVNARPIMNGSGKLDKIVSTFMDVTERKGVEQALLESEKRYATLVEEAPDAIMTLDAAGKILSANIAAEHMLGYKIRDMLGKQVKDITTLTRESLEAALKELNLVIQDQKRPPIELETITTPKLFLEANARAVHRDKKVSGVQIIFRDITARKQTEEILRVKSEELRQANDKLEEEYAKAEALLLSIGDGIMATDDKGHVLLMNHAAEFIMGWTAKSAKGKYFYDIVDIRDKDGKVLALAKRPMHEALKTGKVVKTTTSNTYYIVNHKTKAHTPVAITATPVILSDKTVGAIMVVRDITREFEIDRAKSEFVSLASHQLRTPLSTINWYSEMLLDGDAGPLSDDQKNYLKEIYTGNQRMVDLVNALLNVSRIELGTFAIDPKPTHIEEIVTSVIKEVAPQVSGKAIKLTQKIDPKLPVMKVDPKLVRVVIQNLITNAVKYTPAKKGEILVHVTAKKPDLLITVADNGYGIPKKEQSKIFTKLFRADNVRIKETEGTGLGLYIAKSVVEESGGKIWFESEEHKGTTFYVSLPLEGMKKKLGTKEIT